MSISWWASSIPFLPQIIQQKKTEKGLAHCGSPGFHRRGSKARIRRKAISHPLLQHE